MKSISILKEEQNKSHKNKFRVIKSAKYLYDYYEDLSTCTVTYLYTLRHNKGGFCSISRNIHTIIMCLVRVIIINDNKTIKKFLSCAQGCDRRNNLMSFAVSLS